MAEEGEEGGPAYKFITENQEVKTTSRGYSGKAIAQYPNGDTYDGEFMDGIRESRGTYRYASKGEKYDGEWKDNKACGHGKFTHVEGDTYEGQWANDKANGCLGPFATASYIYIYIGIRSHFGLHWTCF